MNVDTNPTEEAANAHPSTRMHYRTELNNIAKRREYQLRYDVYFEGMPHMAVWHSVVFVNDKICGKGSGKTKGEAKENASKVAYDALEAEAFNDSEPGKKGKQKKTQRQATVEAAIMKRGIRETEIEMAGSQAKND
ncbi:hypothetical protein D9615_003701 [Tricholomella constricta]|uniref:DRBM domain-containing protein n=1 Tax=Tricholomella constricta TaxID=117010 RepID=A0A8H5HII8_9AGAR|nr:hypothetical protein D9615_003701 [Tricholomella constricta]